MSKFYIDTGMWDDGWWYDLGRDPKALFFYLLCQSDCGGVWKQDTKIACRDLQMSPKEYEGAMKGLTSPYEGATKVLLRGYEGALKKVTFVWVVNYVSYQQNTVILNLANSYHSGAWNCLEPHVKLFPEIKEMYEISEKISSSTAKALGRPLVGPSKGIYRDRDRDRDRDTLSQEGEGERGIPDGSDDADYQKIVTAKKGFTIRYEDWIELTTRVYPHSDKAEVANMLSRDLANSMEHIDRPFGKVARWLENSEKKLLSKNPLYDGQGGLRKEMPWSGKPYMDFRRLLVENLFDDRAMLYARMVNEGGKHRYGDPRFDEWCDTDSYIAVVGQYEYSGSDMYDHCLEVMRKDPDGDPLGKVEMAISEGKVFWEVNPNFDMAMIDNESCSLMDMRRSSVGMLPVKKVDFGWRAPAGDWRDKAEGGGEAEEGEADVCVPEK